jgi:hypothetical protein
MMDQDLVVALRDAHRGKNGAGGIGSHQQVDLVDGDELLIKRAREIGLRLVVLDDPFDGTAEQAVLLVELLDIDLADDLVDRRGRRERPGFGKRAADANGRPAGVGQRRRRAQAGNREHDDRQRPTQNTRHEVPPTRPTSSRPFLSLSPRHQTSGVLA